MKLQSTQRFHISSNAPTSAAGHLASKHAALKEKVQRSAYTDYYDRSERIVMREELSVISAQHQALTGHGLS